MGAFGDNLDNRKQLKDVPTYYFTLDAKDNTFIMRGVKPVDKPYIPVASMPLGERVCIKDEKTGEIIPVDTVRQIQGLLTTVLTSDNKSLKAKPGEKNLLLYFNDEESGQRVQVSTSSSSFASAHLMRALDLGNVTKPFMISLGKAKAGLTSTRPFTSQDGNTIQYTPMAQGITGEKMRDEALEVIARLQDRIAQARKNGQSPALPASEGGPQAGEQAAPTPASAQAAAEGVVAAAVVATAEPEVEHFDPSDDDNVPGFTSGEEVAAMRQRG